MSPATPDTRVLSGTLQTWSGDEEPTDTVLDRVSFVFEESWEPGLLVEEIFVATVGDLRVRYSEWYGGMPGSRLLGGCSVKVEGFEHAALVHWGVHESGEGDLQPRPKLVDRGSLEI